MLFHVLLYVFIMDQFVTVVNQNTRRNGREFSTSKFKEILLVVGFIGTIVYLRILLVLWDLLVYQKTA